MAVTMNSTNSEAAAPGQLPWWQRWTTLRVQRILAWLAVIANGGHRRHRRHGPRHRVRARLPDLAAVQRRLAGTGFPVRDGRVPPSRRVHQPDPDGAVLIPSLGIFLALLLAPRRRPSLVRLAAALPAGVLLQAVWGGITVRTGLAWWTVAPHMLVSLALLFVAIAVLVRLGESDGPTVGLVPRPLRILTWATVGVLVLVCMAGTLVTAAGPHGGDASTPRLDLPVQSLAQLHADLMFVYFGLLIALAVGFLAVKAPRKLIRRAGSWSW